MNNVTLHISVLKSDEDHRLQLVDINGSIFAILHSPLASNGPIRLLCEHWNLILLAPIKSKTHVLISGINVICLGEIVSEEGNISLHASRRLVKLVSIEHPSDKLFEIVEGSEYQSEEDVGSVLYYYQLFDSFLTLLQEGKPESLSLAHEKFISALCTLADKASGGSANLNLRQVLTFWGIPLYPRPENS